MDTIIKISMISVSYFVTWMSEKYSDLVDTYTTLDFKIYNNHTVHYTAL